MLVNLDEETREIQRALVDYDAGARRNVAVIGDPLSGKSTLVDAVISRYGQPIRKVNLTSIRDSADDIAGEADGKGIVAIDDCQSLFTRRIDGFAVLEQFLDSTAASGQLYITTWNTFAWNYLEQIFRLNEYFPAIVAMPALDTASIAAIIGARYDPGKVRYIDDARDHGPLAKLRRGSSISIPFFSPGAGLTDDSAAGDGSGLRSAIFAEIAELSNGNPGVAMAIWEKAYRDGEVRTSKINVPDFDIDLDPDQAFVLSNILMMKSAAEDDIRKITAGHLKMDRVLYTLTDRGLVLKKSGRYSVEPLALYQVIHTLKKSRQVW